MSKTYTIAAKIKGKDEASSTFRKFGRNIDRFVGSPIAQVGRNVRALGKSLTSLPVLGSVVGGAYGVGKLAEWIDGFADAGARVEQSAKQAGVAAGLWQELRYVFEQGKVEASEFAQGMNDFNKNLGELRANGGPLYGFLKTVSPGMIRALKATENTTDAFNLMVEAISALKDPSARAKLADAAFSGAGVKMAAVIEQGRAAMDDQRRSARALGVVLDENALKSTEAFNKELGSLKSAWEGVKNTFGLEVVRAGLPYLQKLSSWFKENRGLITQKVQLFAQDFVKGVDAVVTALPSIASSLAKIVDTLGSVPVEVWALLGVGKVLGGVGIGGAVGGAAKGIGGGAAAGGGKTLLGSLASNPLTWAFGGATAAVGGTLLAIGEVPGLLRDTNGPKLRGREAAQRAQAIAEGRATPTVNENLARIRREQGAARGWILPYEIRKAASDAFRDASAKSAEVTLRFVGLPPGMRIDTAGAVATKSDVSTGKRTQGR